MKTLYDLLGARPDDDAETLQNAFRKAAKANHPDLHAGDPDAAKRFRQIAAAYAILRDAEERATYDRLLAFRRQQLRSKLKRNIVSDAIAVVGLAVVLVGGYTLFAHISKTSVAKTSVEAVKVVEVAARGPVEIADVQPPGRTETTDRDEPRDKLARVEVPDMAIAPSAIASEVNSGGALGIADGRPAEIAAVPPAALSETTDRDEPRDKLARLEVPNMAIASSAVESEANSGGAVGIADGGPALNSTGRDTEVATITNAFVAPIDQTDVKTTADLLKRNGGIEPLDQNKARSVDVQFSSLEKDHGVPKSSSSDFAISDEKHDLKIPQRPRMVAKRQATNRAPFKQVSLENKNTSACSGLHSCSGDVPPLFGVGF
jgi:curved DNA-binding protein CbpA